MRVFDSKSGKTFYEKRRRRYDEPGHARELTFCCYQGFKFLRRDRTCQWFIEALSEARKKWLFDLWAYVIMPEHVHLLIHPHDPNLQAERMVGEIKEKVARKAISYIENHAPEWLSRITVQEGKRTRRRFWQLGGGFDRNAIEPSTIYHMIDYIHANPVRRSLVEHAEDWHWSSAKWYGGIRPVPIEIDGTLPTLHSEGS